MPNNLPGNDGLFVAPTEGEERARSMQFFSTVPGAECSGPEFKPDNSALFVSVQHPGEGGTFEAPVTLWPTGAGHGTPERRGDHGGRSNGEGRSPGLNRSRLTTRHQSIRNTLWLESQRVFHYMCNSNGIVVRASGYSGSSSSAQRSASSAI